MMATMAANRQIRTFYGWRVVAAVFVLATFGWGVGFYGPPIYLHTVRETRGWSLDIISTAVTIHFLFGAIVIAILPKLYQRFGVPRVTKAGAIGLAVGVVGWAIAREPWQLFIAVLLSGGGWVTMGAAAVNAIVAPWFVRMRPVALASAYNGSSVGGIIFSPLWVVAIGLLGFPGAAILIGLVMIVTIWILADRYYRKTPELMGLKADGDAANAVLSHHPTQFQKPLPRRQLWRDWRFVTLAAGMALGLFAQIGLLAHLFSLLVPALGAQLAGFAIGTATAAAIAGRALVGWLMPVAADRRLFGCGNYVVQILGSLAFALAAGENVPLLLLGVVLFGAGIGNTTSLPPLIAQSEFVHDDVSRVVPLIVGIGQATYAFAPAVFGFLRDLGPALGSASVGAAPYVFITAALVQASGALAFLIGRQRITEMRPTVRNSRP
jgi:MFS family permease